MTTAMISFKRKKKSTDGFFGDPMDSSFLHHLFPHYRDISERNSRSGQGFSAVPVPKY